MSGPGLYELCSISARLAVITFDLIRGDYFRFGSVFTYKNQPNRFFFWKKNWTETESNRPVSVRFGSVLDFKKPRKPIRSYFLSNSPVAFSQILFSLYCANCKQPKAKNQHHWFQLKNKNKINILNPKLAINQNPKFLAK